MEKRERRSFPRVGRGWDAERRKRFLDALRDSGNVTLATKATGHLSASSAYALRGEDPEFAEAWDQAIRDAVSRIESGLVAQAMAAIEAQKAELDGGSAAKPLDFEQMMKLLSYYRSTRDTPVRGGPQRRYATRAETDAALMKKLDVLEARVRARQKREAAERKAARANAAAAAKSAG